MLICLDVSGQTAPEQVYAVCTAAQVDAARHGSADLRSNWLPFVFLNGASK